MKRHLGTRALIVLLAVVGTSWASEFTEGFESYVAGTSMHGQGGWKGWDNASAVGAPVSNDVSRSGRNSVEIRGSSDLVHPFNLVGGKWVITAWQFIPTGAKGVTYFILLNTYADGGPYDWSAQTEYDMTDGTITPYGQSVSDARILYDRWVEIKFELDLTANTFSEYYDGEVIATGQWDDTGNGRLQAIDLYGNAASSVYYDDIRIDAPAVGVGGSCFPRPAYDSGWIATPFGSPEEFYTIRLEHGLGGNLDNYFVDLQRDVSGIAGPNLSNQGLGSAFFYNFLNTRSVNVTAPYSAVDLVNSVRIRIWVYDCDTDSTPAPGTPK